MFKQAPASRTMREANRAFKLAQPETTEYARTQKAFHDNRERLKSERLVREAAAGAHTASERVCNQPGRRRDHR